MEKSTKGLTDEQIEEITDNLPWYTLGRVVRVKLPAGGHAYEINQRSLITLGPNLLWDFLAEWRSEPFKAGVWIVGAYIPATDTDLPDWGTLTVRGPGSWVLRSRDGRQAWAAGRNGTLICLQQGRAES